MDDVVIPDLAARKPVPIGALQPTDINEDSRRLAARLSLALREGCGLRAAATVSASATGRFDHGLSGNCASKGAAIACFTSPGGEMAAMLMLSAPLANALIETACGGQPGPASPRQLTPLDGALLEALVRPLGAAIAPGLKFSRIENDVEFASALAGPASASILDLDVRVDSARMPARLILAEDDLFDLASARQPTAAKAAPAPAQKPAASAMTAILTARVASLSVPLSRLTDLKAGSTLLLGIPADQPVALLAGGRDGMLAAEGQIGRKGNKIALRITNRGPALNQG